MKTRRISLLKVELEMREGPPIQEARRSLAKKAALKLKKDGPIHGTIRTRSHVTGPPLAVILLHQLGIWNLRFGITALA
jgi:hypothetical protein